MIADLGRPEDYADGGIRIVDVGGLEVGVVRWGQDFYAVRNVCPHQAGPVCAGLVRPGIVSTGRPGELALDPEAPILACPWHGWEFDVRTGKSISAGPQKVRTYSISIEGGRLLIDVPGRPR
jgi:nitrite reductase/ring-hydroxylating ferredoxin subunit